MKATLPLELLVQPSNITNTYNIYTLVIGRIRNTGNANGIGGTPRKYCSRAVRTVFDSLKNSKFAQRVSDTFLGKYVLSKDRKYIFVLHKWSCQEKFCVESIESSVLIFDDVL